jgi:hypothetical protein
MKKLLGAAAVCALTVGLVAAPGASAVKSPKQVSGTVSVSVTPSPIPSSATTVTATGNLSSNSGCRKDRLVHFAWVSGATVVPLGPAFDVETGPNGNYTATLPRPTDPPFTPPTTVALQATVDFAVRKVGSKKKGKKDKPGRKFHCLRIAETLSGPIALEAPPAP